MVLLEGRRDALSEEPRVLAVRGHVRARPRDGGEDLPGGVEGRDRGSVRGLREINLEGGRIPQGFDVPSRGGTRLQPEGHVRRAGRDPEVLAEWLRGGHRRV